MDRQVAVRRCDLAVVGSGGAGFAAAIAARRAGLRVVMVERGVVGGTCMNTGCVPSKVLLAAAGARRQAGEERFPGVATQAGPVNFGELTEAKRSQVEGMRTQKYVGVAAGYGWDILAGTARFAGTAAAPVLEVSLADGHGVRIEAEHYLVATGSAPWAPPINGLAEAGYLTSTTAMELTELPGSLLVLGGNAVGLEQAQLFAHLGVKVTLVEAMERLAPFEEPEISAAITDVLAGDGVEVVNGAKVASVDRDAGGYQLGGKWDGERDLELGAAQLLVATGRRPVTDHLGLEAVGVETGERGAVRVDAYLQTTNPQIWAAGDVTGAPQYVYLAAAQGSAMVDNAFRQAGRTVDLTLVPRVTFTTPAIAAVGLTEAQADSQAGVACECRVLPLDQVPRALVNRDTRGVIKLVAERASGRIRGVHVVADGAGEMIQAAGYALECGVTADQMAQSWSPFLTMTEGLKLAALSFTRDVAKLSCCAT